MPSRMEYDVVIVGGSPSGFALAHRLVDLASKSKAKFTIAIIEKGKEFGSNVVSGAVSNLRVIEKLFPDYKSSGFPLEGICTKSYLTILGKKKKWHIPGILLPKGLKKEGSAILTLSHVVYWMYKRLKEKLTSVPNVEVDFFPGFSAHKIIFEKDKVIGIKVIEQDGENLDSTVYAKVFCFGDKGFVSRDITDKFNLRENPQTWSIGVKEVWQLTPDKDFRDTVYHTLGFPLLDGSFGGSFIYGMKENKIAIGLVVSLSSANPNINPQQRLQDLKKHPWIQEIIKDGKLLKYGAAVLPEGGYYSLPKKFAVGGALLLGDALGVLDIERLSGIDKSMESGYQAANVVHECILKNDFSENILSTYQEKLMASFVGKELKKGRYFRYATHEESDFIGDCLLKLGRSIDNLNPYIGCALLPFSGNPFKFLKDAVRLAGLILGKDIGQITYNNDYENIVPSFNKLVELKMEKFKKETIYSRADAVFYAKTKYHEESNHIDEFNPNVCITCIKTYDNLQKDTPCVSDCTAEVHRVDIKNGNRIHGMSLENCIHCRTCEIVCPEVNLRVKPTEEGSGPDFMGL